MKSTMDREVYTIPWVFLECGERFEVGRDGLMSGL